ncbi:secretory carrier-associated membrane protein 3-like isoform X1 [Brienomyrus brachyistius]|uniref:secretory carrier-associated membrane protein 3-like isoform X1 n=1 Tax=Brienomyrus brachyistius TaxID=42636 RepID=UPI0020B218D8|nr:secretory carrier-associated membrane protein 3-like isoform X1 [Brienomyrus brachyistius]XP_048857157.1 secretory carrier-associated membrane protein 3-like isoform X1 [Brienomyrus brachyistius]
MSQYTSFPEPMDDHNPFQDPALTQHGSNTEYATLDLYNPFEDKPMQPPPPYSATVPTAPPVPSQAPPTRITPTESRNYGSYTTQPSVNATTAELLRRQEELERKARDLERRERELGSHALGPGATRQNNWPPLPSFCPVGPCFYQDITIEISQQFQRTVTIMYYYWIFTACILLFNLICCLAQFCVDTTTGVGLGLAILWVILFTPCSFVCWYRPVYKAFRSDSSFNFFAFFFVFFAQIVLYVLMTIGIPNWGFSGWIVSLATLRKNVAVGVIMLLGAANFTAQAVIGGVLLKKVHSLYRQTGASFQKAQAEFATGVMSNQAVRQATATAAASAAQGAFTGAR